MYGKKYFWLKLRRDFFKRHDIRILKAMDNGEAITLFYIELLAESVDHGGALRYSPSKPYTPDMLAVIFDTNAAFVGEALEVLETAELIKTEEDGTIVLPKALELIGNEADNDNARRQARYRERKRLENTQDVTNSITDNVTNNVTSNVTRNVTECYDVTDSNKSVVTKNNESKRKSKSKEIELEYKRESIERENDTAAAVIPSPSKPHFVPPSPDDILNYMTDYSVKRGLTVDVVREAELFFNHFSANGWKVSGRAPMKDYKAAASNWLLRAQKYSSPAQSVNPFGDLDI